MSASRTGYVVRKAGAGLWQFAEPMSGSVIFIERREKGLDRYLLRHHIRTEDGNMPARRLKFTLNNHREHRAKGGRACHYHFQREMRLLKKLKLQRIFNIEARGLCRRCLNPSA